MWEFHGREYKKQDKKLDTADIEEDFYEYKKSIYRTKWEIAFEQGLFLAQNKTEPGAKLENLNIEITSHNKRTIQKKSEGIFINLAATYSPFF